MKYLVVDDSRMARKMLIKNLKELISEEDEIIQASNGEEAVDLFDEHKPRICFMDLTMPVMDGFDAIKVICTDNENAKIIVVSADIQEYAMQRAKENGAIGFIKKPVDQNNLKEMLTELGLV